MWALLFIFLWPSPELSQTVYNRGHDLGPLAETHHYGADNFCSVQARPLYTGEVEGLPLYAIFNQELTDLVGFEFRIIYYTEPAHNIDGCTPINTPSCRAPLSYDYDGYCINITEEEKFLFEISKYKPLQTIYY
jgi:hypothetical protein